MRIGVGLTGTAAVGTDLKARRFSKMSPSTVRAGDGSRRAAENNFLREWTAEENEKDKGNTLVSLNEAEEVSDGRSEAVKIYEAAFQGGENPIENLRSASKVPYGHLAKDGVIIYNGVVFTCDERTNSICLGDVETDKKQVLNIPLSGGGQLKVNRANLDQLGKAIGMFSPEDVNRIMRAIHQDTKVQSMQKEIEDMEAGVGEQITSGEDAAETNSDAGEK